MDYTKQIEQARQAIQLKQYDRARAILTGMDDPKARELLKALDRIAPKKQESSGWTLIGIGVVSVILLGVVIFIVTRPSEPEAAPDVVIQPTIPTEIPSATSDTRFIAVLPTPIAAVTDNRLTLPPTWTALPSATITDTPIVLYEHTVAVKTISVIHTANAVATYDSQSTAIASNSGVEYILPTYAVVENPPPVSAQQPTIAPPAEPQAAVDPTVLTCPDAAHAWAAAAEYAALNTFLEAVGDVYEILEYKQGGGLLWEEPIAEAILVMQGVRDAAAAYAFQACLADYHTLLTGSMDKLMQAFSNYTYDLIPVETFNLETQSSVEMWNQAETLLNQLRAG